LKLLEQAGALVEPGVEIAGDTQPIRGFVCVKTEPA
jgi:hypothetical protein